MHPTIVIDDGYSDTTVRQIKALIWEGSTTAADVVEVYDAKSGALLWACRASGTNTYEGITFFSGVSAQGISVTLPSGRVLVYT